MFLRLDFAGGNGSIGPARATILEAIDRFGSISAAAPAVDLSSRQLWTLVQILNSLFDEPLIEIRRSGRSSGAILTPLGREVLAHFRKMEHVANKALATRFRKFEKLVGADPGAPPPIPRFAQIADPNTIQASKKNPATRIKKFTGIKRKT